jgi:Flp pilus assembly pilin Flp
LLVGLIAVAIIVAVTFLGDTLKGLFENVNTKLTPSSGTN